MSQKDGNIQCFYTRANSIFSSSTYSSAEELLSLDHSRRSFHDKHDKALYAIVIDIELTF